jgi:hypothetical protein
MKYYIANENRIPLHSQPENGYTELQVIARIQREIEECIKLFGGSFKEYKNGYFTILDKNFHDVTADFKNAI